jgi:hypothetical protein
MAQSQVRVFRHLLELPENELKRPLDIGIGLDGLLDRALGRKRQRDQVAETDRANALFGQLGFERYNQMKATSWLAWHPPTGPVAPCFTYFTASFPYSKVIDSSGPSSPGPDQSILVVKTLPNVYFRNGLPALPGSVMGARKIQPGDSVSSL